mmetsp:Transcript_44466/g.73774  ORF Transcript_44466/g.73774 Transcript_44466/m.73774 type:complete len:232 (-) Transcript_44466:379-1074(-)
MLTKYCRGQAFQLLMSMLTLTRRVCVALVLIDSPASHAASRICGAPRMLLAQLSTPDPGAPFAAHHQAWETQLAQRNKWMEDRRAKYVQHAATMDMSSETGRLKFFQGMWGVIRSELKAMQMQLQLAPNCLAAGTAELEAGELDYKALDTFKRSRKKLIRQKNQKISLMRRLDDVRRISDRVARQRLEVDKLRASLAEAEMRLASAESEAALETTKCTEYVGKLVEAGFEV